MESSCREAGAGEARFRVSVSLEQFFSDERARCLVSVGAARRVRWLRRRLRRLFALRGPLALLARGHLLPPDETIAPLLRPDDHVQVVRATVELNDRPDSPETTIEPTEEYIAQAERQPPTRKRKHSVHQESPRRDLADVASNVHQESPRRDLTDIKSNVQREISGRDLTDAGSNIHQVRPRSDLAGTGSNMHRKRSRESFDSDQVDISLNNCNIADRTADAAITSTEDVFSALESIHAREDYLNEMKARTLRMIDEIAPAQRRRRTRRRRRPKSALSPALASASASTPTPTITPATTFTPIPVAASTIISAPESTVAPIPAYTPTPTPTFTPSPAPASTPTPTPTFTPSPTPASISTPALPSATTPTPSVNAECEEGELIEDQSAAETQAAPIATQGDESRAARWWVQPGGAPAVVRNGCAAPRRPRLVRPLADWTRDDQFL